VVTAVQDFREGFFWITVYNHANEIGSVRPVASNGARISSLQDGYEMLYDRPYALFPMNTGVATLVLKDTYATMTIAGLRRSTKNQYGEAILSEGYSVSWKYQQGQGKHVCFCYDSAPNPHLLTSCNACRQKYDSYWASVQLGIRERTGLGDEKGAEELHKIVRG